MKVAFVTQPTHAVLPPSGSLELWTREVARRLAPEHDVTVFATRSDDTEHAERDGVRYRLINHAHDHRVARVARPAWRLLPDDRAYFATPLYALLYWSRVGRELRRGGYEVAHIFNYSQALPILARLAPGTKLVLHMQCEWLTQLSRPMLERRLSHADLILGCSRPITNGIRARFPATAERAHTVFNGIDAAALACARDPRGAAHKLLYVGRLSPEKGLHLLVDAFNELISRRPELELTLVGEEATVPPSMLVRLADDPRIRELEAFYAGSYAEALVQRLSPEARSRVRFTGAVPYADVHQHYREADVFVLPSLMEAFGMPLAEALAAGLPAVASRTGGIVDIVDDGETGRLVDPGDPDALAAAIDQLLDDPALRAAFSENGRAKARTTFDWDTTAGAVAVHFASLLPRGHSERHAAVRRQAAPQTGA
jgi:spore coat protein SA